MKVGIIAPIKFLNKYCVTNIQYCLPSLFTIKEYRNFYVSRYKSGDTIILDCKRVGWRRTGEFLPVIQEALKLIQPTYIILPSRMYNLTETIALTKRYLEALPKRFQYVGCLEGTDKREIGKCLEKIRKISTTIAVPSHIYNLWKGEEYKHQTIFIENHSCPDELIDQEGILVTSLPVRLGLQGRFLSDYLPGPPTLTYHESEDKYPEITRSNVEELIELYEPEL